VWSAAPHQENEKEMVVLRRGILLPLKYINFPFGDALASPYKKLIMWLGKETPP